MSTIIPSFYRPERELFELLLSTTSGHEASGADLVQMHWFLVSVLLAGEACSCASNRVEGGFCFAIDCKGRSLFLSLVKGMGSLDGKSVLQAHSLLMGGGKSRFRDKVAFVGVRSIEGYGFVAPVYDVKSDLTWMLRCLQGNSSKSDLVGFMASFLYYFLHLHPFLDGNGRASRLLLAGAVSLCRGLSQLAPALFVLAAFQLNKREFIGHLHAARVFDVGCLGRLVLSKLQLWEVFSAEFATADQCLDYSLMYVRFRQVNGSI